MQDSGYNTIISYFAELDATDEVSARSMGVIRYRAPSIGMYSLKMDVKGVFSIPTTAFSKGMMMDVDRVMQGVFSKDGNQNKVRQYMLSSGNISSLLEHVLPEFLFSTDTKSIQGISAVKAVQLANSQGIPIYTINQMNVNAILPKLQLDSTVKVDIQNSVNAGKVVTVSKTNVVLGGWSGCGYTVIDPNTGAGAYMISEGANGGLLFEAIVSIISHLLVTEAEAAELEETYITQAPAPVIQSPPPPEPPCLRHYHPDEFKGCIALVIGNNVFYEGLTVGLGTALGGFIFGGITVGYIVSAIVLVSLLAVVGYIINDCRKSAWHC